MRIGFVELVLLLFIASITVGPNVALFVDRWLRRAQRTSAAAARRKAQLEAQAAIEREALMTRFRVASNIFALLMLAALAYGLLLRPIDTPPKAYTAPDVRQDTGAAQTALSADSKDGWKLGGYLGVDCVRPQDGLVYAAAYNGAAMKKRQSDLVRTAPRSRRRPASCPASRSRCARPSPLRRTKRWRSTAPVWYPRLPPPRRPACRQSRWTRRTTAKRKTPATASLRRSSAGCRPSPPSCVRASPCAASCILSS